MRRDRKYVVKLLLLSNEDVEEDVGDRHHWVLICDLGTLLNSSTSNKHKIFPCPFCLYRYKVEELPLSKNIFPTVVSTVYRGCLTLPLDLTFCNSAKLLIRWKFHLPFSQISRVILRRMKFRLERPQNWSINTSPVFLLSYCFFLSRVYQWRALGLQWGGYNGFILLISQSWTCQNKQHLVQRRTNDPTEWSADGEIYCPSCNVKFTKPNIHTESRKGRWQRVTPTLPANSCLLSAKIAIYNINSKFVK